MITKLSAQNFKSWRDTGTLRLAPLTGLFGANSSGKTSILQVLLLLKQTVERPPDWNEALYFGDERSLVNLGSFDNVIHRSEEFSEFEISVSWELLEKLTILNMVEIDTLSFFCGLLSGILYEFRYRSGEHDFRMRATEDTDRDYMTFTSYGEDYVESLFRCYGIRDVSMLTEGIFSQLETAFENLFSRIHYLGPLREYPRRNYTWEESHPKDVGLYGEKMISALLSSRVQNRFTDEQIMKWLQKLELIYSYALNSTSNTEQNYEFLVKQYKGGPEVRLTDVGFGVSQVLPVLILCYYAPEGSILILEQPEAHLHPKVQTELADVLIDVVKNRNIQIILESHSEYLLSRLQRRIAEKEIAAADTALYFCEIKDGTSEIEQLNVDEYGNIRNWPQDFFGDVTGELIKKTKVEMQQRKVMG